MNVSTDTKGDRETSIDLTKLNIQYSEFDFPGIPKRRLLILSFDDQEVVTPNRAQTEDKIWSLDQLKKMTAGLFKFPKGSTKQTADLLIRYLIGGGILEQYFVITKEYGQSGTITAECHTAAMCSVEIDGEPQDQTSNLPVH